jgi:hypothetical protein
MKYKAEVTYNRRVVLEDYYRSLTHPNQAVKKIVSKMKTKPDFFVIYVINEEGDYWRYRIRIRKDGKFYVDKMEKSNFMKNQNDVALIFSGNATVSGY